MLTEGGNLQVPSSTASAADRDGECREASAARLARRQARRGERGEASAAESRRGCVMNHKVQSR